MRRSLVLSGVIASALVLSSCTTGNAEETVTPSQDIETPELPAGEAPSVVVTTTVLGSVVADILTCAVGDDSSMTVLMPVGADPHDFQASSAQGAQMAAADLVVANGLGLEEGVLDALENVRADGVSVIEIAPLVDPLPFGEASEAHSDHDHDHDHSDEGATDEDEHDHGDFDPHFWLDMERMAMAATLIGAELAGASGADFEDCGEQVAQAILQAEADVAASLARVPEARRVLVTDHDALGYLADRYGYEVVGVVIPGGSTLGDPNSQELASLVSVIQAEQVPAIFGDVSGATDLLETLSAEVGGEIQVVELFVGSLGGPGSGAESYVEMMTTNASRIAQALAD